MRKYLTVVIGLFILVVASVGLAANRSNESEFDLKLLYQEVRMVARRHYPKVSSHQLGNKIHFEHDTRLFVVHESLKTGEWQDPWEVRGPKKNGILVDVELNQGRWHGAAVVPQSFDKRYFTVLLMAPYSEKLDAHLVATIKYPRHLPEGFLVELTDLIKQFDKHVTKKTAE